MELYEVLHQLHRDHIVIIPDRQRLVIWPGADLETRRVISRHRRLVRALIEESDISVCPSPALHRRSWRHAGQQKYICGICEQITKYWGRSHQR